MTITVNPDLSVVIETDTRICHLPKYHPETQLPWANAQEAQTFAEGIQHNTRYMIAKADPTPAGAREAKLAAIKSMVESLLAAGAPVDHSGATYSIGLEDGTRADLTAMATTALGVIGGALTWPASYVTGWITMENIRIPLLQPTDGLALAALVGDYYAQIRQRGRDLKDSVLAAADDAAIDAIDIGTGWP